MDSQPFDRLSKRLAGSLSRRQLLGGAGVAATSTLVLRLAGHSDAQTLSPATPSAVDLAESEEESVELMEQIAEIYDSHIGSCAGLQRKLFDFTAVHGARLEQLRIEQDQWDHDRRVAHADAYGDRREAATTKVLASLSRCSFAAPGVNALGTPVTDIVPSATPVAGLYQFHSASKMLAAQSSCLATTTTDCCGPISLTCYSPIEYGSTEAGTIAGTITTDPCVYDNGTTCGTCFNSSTGYSDQCTTAFPQVCGYDSQLGLLCLTSVADLNMTPLQTPTASPLESYCTQNCPPSSADCALNYAGGGAGSTCNTCLASWCGSTDWCIEHCESENECDGACSDSYVPPPPAGE